MRRYFIVPLLLLVAACAGDKYPYPSQFVNVGDVPASVLAAPPAADSDIQKKEIASIIATQARLSEKTKAQIMAEDHISPEMIVTRVLGAHINATDHPALFVLLRHSASDAWRIADSVQEHYNRTRPWLVDSRVALLVSPIKRPSYPSGHSTTNHVWAHVLAELFPNKRDALFARAHEIGMHRSNAGVHYPSDVVAGKKIAAIIFKNMRRNAQFQRELNAAREELNHPVAANDNVSPHGDAANCNTPEPGVSMTMCK